MGRAVFDRRPSGPGPSVVLATSRAAIDLTRATAELPAETGSSRSARHRPRFSRCCAGSAAVDALAGRRRACAGQHRRWPCRSATRRCPLCSACGEHDLIALLDVLEHVDNRPGDARSIGAKLAPAADPGPCPINGCGARTTRNHHKLRYSKPRPRRSRRRLCGDGRLFQQPARRRRPDRRQDRASRRATKAAARPLNACSGPSSA